MTTAAAGTILITGATDGIGLATARMLASEGHRLLVHGRDPAKLDRVVRELAREAGSSRVEACRADLSILTEVDALARSVATRQETIDVLINNAGVFRSARPVTPDGLDVRFAVNTIAPYYPGNKILA